jgi:predicted NAD-dependent protein-ADP-ribosyltransferase YbiA (DUF1768 family)
MEEKFITIQKPEDYPFGQLSNEYKYDMLIDGKKWDTVINYVLSNMMVNPSYRNMLQNAEPYPKKKNYDVETILKAKVKNMEKLRTADVGDFIVGRTTKLTPHEIALVKDQIIRQFSEEKLNIYQLYNHLLNKEYSDTVRIALEKSLNAKISENEELSKVLLSTDNKPIHYVSNNNVIGLGPDGDGMNLLGKTLEQIRHNIRMEIKLKQEQSTSVQNEDTVFDVYKAYVMLQKELSQGNDLSDYVGLSAKEIVNTYIGKNSDESKDEILSKLNLSDESTVRSSVMDIYNRGGMPILKEEIKKPGYMVDHIRRENIALLKQNRIVKEKETILKLYTEFLIKQKYPNLSKKNTRIAISQLLSTIPESKEEEQYNMYEEVRKYIISNEKGIDRESAILSLKNLYPNMTDEEIEKALKYVLEPMPSSDAYEKMKKYETIRDQIATLYYEGKLGDELSSKIRKTLKIEMGAEVDSDSEKDSEESKAEGSDSEDNSKDSQEDRAESDEKDPIKKLLGSDNKSRKTYLIQRLQKYTGKPYEKYRDYSIEKLESKLLKYEKGIEAPKADGNWIIKISHVSGKKETVKYGPEKPDIVDFLKSYNKKRKRDKKQPIRKGQISTFWQSDVKAHAIVNIDESKNDIFSHSDYMKTLGEPVLIRTLPQDNDPAFVEFSPIYEKIFYVGGVTYPSISIFITTMLISQLGLNTSFGKTIRRGMSMLKARDYIVKGTAEIFKDENDHITSIDKAKTESIQDFLNPDQATVQYQTIKEDTFSKLIPIYLKIALEKKFEVTDGIMNLRNIGDKTSNIGYNELQDILILTDGSKIYVNQPEDEYVAVVTAKILENIRSIIQENRKNDPIFTTLLDEKDLVQFVRKDDFMFKWVLSKLSDMCNTVYKLKEYIYINAGINQDIDSKFVKTALQKIYQPCGWISKITNTVSFPVIEEFFVSTRSCLGLEKFVQDYEKSIKEIIDSIQEQERIFWNLSKPIETEIPSESGMTEEEKEEFKKMVDGEKRKRYKLKIENKYKDLLEKLEVDDDYLEKSMSLDFEKDEELKKDGKVALEPIEIDRMRMEFILSKRYTGYSGKSRSDDELKAFTEQQMESLNKEFTEKKGLDILAYKEILDKRNELEVRHREEQKKLLRKLLKPKYPDAEISEKLKELREEMNKKAEKTTSWESRVKIEKQYKKKISKVWRDMTSPKKQSEEITKAISDLTDKQMNESSRLYNWGYSKISSTFGVGDKNIKKPADINEHNKNIQKQRKILQELMKKKKEEYENILLNSVQVSETYWNWIMSMIYFLTSRLGENATKENIRKTILTIGEISSSKTFNCESGSDGTYNLKDEEDNCIASAIFNVMVGIQGFKFNYADNIKIGKSDIDLAVSIILGSKGKDREFYEAEEVTEEDVLNEVEGKEDEQDIEDEVKEEIGNEDMDYEEMEEKYGAGEMYDEEVEFGMRKRITKPEDDKETVRMLLRQISKKELSDSDILVEYFLKSIQTIKNTKMRDGIKRNRINFFASQR